MKMHNLLFGSSFLGALSLFKVEFKVVLHRSHGYFFGVKVKTVKLLERRRFLALYACPNNTNDVIHSDHGYLETWEIPGGPP